MEAQRLSEEHNELQSRHEMIKKQFEAVTPQVRDAIQKARQGRDLRAQIPS